MADSVVEMFRKSGALLTGHFLLTSGLHSPEYWEKAKVLQYPACTEQLCRMIADRFRDAGVDVVAGPTTPGIILAYETARQLGEPVRAAFAEPVPEGGRSLRRGWSVASSERVVLVDDILTTGASLVETVEAVRAAGADVVDELVTDEDASALAVAVRVRERYGLDGIPLVIDFAERKQRRRAEA